jgi:hypothetical protein
MPEEAARVHIRPVSHPEYDETNWWQHKEGSLDLFDSYVRLGYVWLCGEGTGRWHEWNAEEYESRLR